MGLFNRVKNIIRANDALEEEKAKDDGISPFLKIQRGNSLSIDGDVYYVDGLIKYDGGNNWYWYEYKLVSGDDNIWFRVINNDVVDLSMHREFNSVSIVPAQTIEYDDTTYFGKVRGQASVMLADGQVGVDIGHNVNFFYYIDETGNKFFSIYEYSRGREVSYGCKLNDYQVSIYG